MRTWRSRFILPVFLHSWKRCAASPAEEFEGGVCGRLLPIGAAPVRERFPEVAIRLTQVGAVGSTEWGGALARAEAGDRPTLLCGCAFYAAARWAAPVAGFRAASHKAAGDPRANAPIGRIADGSRTPPSHTPKPRTATATPAMRSASRRRNSRRLSSTPPRQNRLPRMKPKYAAFHQLPCFSSSARKWLLAAIMARN